MKADLETMRRVFSEGLKEIEQIFDQMPIPEFPKREQDVAVAVDEAAVPEYTGRV